MKRLQLVLFMAVLALSLPKTATASEIYCTIRSGAANLDCQIVGKERKVMTDEDVSNFIDSAQTKAYIVMKSRRGVERVFMLDPKAPQFKQLNDIKKSSAISVVARSKTALFDEIEKKIIKLSDDLDAAMDKAELVLQDPGIGYDKFKLETSRMVSELEDLKKNSDKICTTTPAYEQISKSRASLQQTLSDIIYAFQTPGTCMEDFKVFKDRDGTVDLRQLKDVAAAYKNQCKK